jgi:hypothetical protein
MVQALALAVWLVAASSPGWAELKSGPFNFSPTTGLLNTPVAAVLAPGQARVTGNSASVNDLSDDSGSVAIGPAEGLELSVMGLQRYAWTVNLQALALDEAKGAPFSFALGVQNLAERHVAEVDEMGHPSMAYRSVYAVVSKRVASTARLHLGTGGGRFDGVFGGADVFVTPDLQLMAEWDGQETNAGFRWTALHASSGAVRVNLVGAYLDMCEPSVGVEVVLGR